MHVPLASPRYSITPVPGGLRAAIPARRNVFGILFLCAWLTGWAVGEVNVMSELLHPAEKSPSLFLAAWLAGWTLGGAFALGTVLWQLAGREVISVDPATFEHRIEVFGVGRSRQYAVAEIRNLRVAPQDPGGPANPTGWVPTWTGPGHGPLAFDHGARTFRFGAALDEAESRMLLEQLASRLPRTLTAA